MRPQIIYLLGVIPMGLAYYPIKAALGGPAFLVLVVGYAVMLRLLAQRLGIKA